MNKDKELLELNNIKKVCKALDFLSDPDIEDSWVCLNECCRYVETSFFSIFENPSQELQDLLGYEGLQLTHQLNKIVVQIVRQIDCHPGFYEIEKRLDSAGRQGFSETQEWLDFVNRINKVNIFLKGVLRKHGRIID